MKRTIALLLTLGILCSGVAYSEGKATITNKNLILFPNDDNGYFFAKVENLSEETVGVDTGNLVIFSTEDDIILSDSYITTLPSYVKLNPGDYLYVRESLWDGALENAEIGDYKFSMPAEKKNKEYHKVTCEAKVELEGGDSYDNYVYVTFSNKENETLFGCNAVVALFDAEGTICFVDSYSLSNVGIHNNSTISVRLTVDKDLVEYCEANSIIPTSVDAYVYYFD